MLILTFLSSFVQVSLAEVMAVQWLDKRGTAIVCLNLVKEGRLLVKTSLDLNGWFDSLQVHTSAFFFFFKQKKKINATPPPPSKKVKCLINLMVNNAQVNARFHYTFHTYR